MSASVIFVQLASLSNKAGHLLASTFVYIAAERPLYLTRQENKRHPLETQESPWRNPRKGLNIRYMIETKSKNPPSRSLCREKHFLPLLSSFPLLRGGKRVPSCSSNHLQLPAEILNQRFLSDLALVESLHFKRRENCFFSAGKHLSTRVTPLLHRQTQLPDEIQSINISGCLFLQVNLFRPFEEKTNPILLVKRCEIAANC